MTLYEQAKIFAIEAHTSMKEGKFLKNELKRTELFKKTLGLVGAGAAEGAQDAANMLKPALARGELRAIGATTLDEYRKYIEKDGALERRFQPVIVKAPSVPEAIEIIKGLRHKYEAHHRVKITEQAITAALNPAAGDWLYFITVDLGTQETRFTRSYSEFLTFKDQFLAYCSAHPGTC